MRALKTLLIILVALAAVVFLLYLLGPAETHMVRTTVVKAPPSAVYPYMNDMKRINVWSPWIELDSTAKITYEGADGQVGSSSNWDGKMLGKGGQTITALEQDKRVGVGLKFLEPFEGQATADFELEDLGDSTRVLWHYDAENKGFARIMGLFMDGEQMMGPVFESGLSNLKALVEKEYTGTATATYDGYEIEVVDRPLVVYLGKRGLVKWKDMDAFMGKAYQDAAAAATKAAKPIVGPASAVYYRWDEVGQQAELLAGFPVEAAADTKVDGADVQAVDAGKALMTIHRGGYAASGNAHMAMDKMIKDKGVGIRDHVVEEYIVGPGAEPDSTKWVTHIYYMIK